MIQDIRIIMAIKAIHTTLVEESIAMSIAVKMYLNRADEQADPTVIATRNIICAPTVTLGIAVRVVNLELDA
ncbi:Uncharacterised protein [Legionella quateirensis]|uniref:Uncharacterized protein n=2 Tax=Legionella quateirensis TaxID=45072 RepID=A0A378KX58_9GAMM|nr:hypothetical protein Lqua_0539 [Legionella quateirensis]STY19123.1 Uncharacterised protein [Legionella quateirensis]